MVLNGINIRSGLELEVPVSEIFKVNVVPEGNIIAKHFFQKEDKNGMQTNGELNRLLDVEQIVTYNDLKIPQKITDTLTCYLYDSYLIYREDSPDGFGKVEVEKTIELVFVNNEMLDFEMFCSNLMAAQAFTGNFDKPHLNHHFIGVGNFNFEDYISIHSLVAHSNINLINFFIFYKKVLSSIGYFVCGLYENDIQEQKKYLTDQEYKSVMSIAKRRKRDLMNSFKRIDETETDLFF